MFARSLAPILPELLRYFSAISVTGPRQSGKTTLCRQVFQTLPYVLLEDPDTRLFAETDPRQFLAQFPNGAILDEVQRVPNLFSYLQGVLDADASRKFVLSGSQNFLMMAQISQSLAGRVGLTTLLPLSWAELKQPETPLADWLFYGGYPARAERQIPAPVYFASYLQTYLERDVRSLKNIGDLTLFTRFVKLCAGRVGQLLNVSSLATDAGISPKTAEAWLSVLETSYVVYRLQPYHQNWGKRLTKTAKLYFFDTGLLCYLLDIQQPAQVLTHFAYGSIFENAVLLELMKADYHAGRRPSVFFWRDSHGNEVDFLLERGGRLLPVEVKASQTASPRLWRGLQYWNTLSGNDPRHSFLVYAGGSRQDRTETTLLPWQMLAEVA